MLLALKILKNNWREVGIGLLLLAVIVEGRIIHSQYVELEEAKLVYKNPQVKEVVREVIVERPAIIKEKIVRVPGGKETIEKIVYIGGTETVKESDKAEAPVSLKETLEKPRTDRWLAGFALDPGRPKDAHGYKVLGGYSIKGRLDLLAGVGYDEKVETQFQAVLRF